MEQQKYTTTGKSSNDNSKFLLLNLPNPPDLSVYRGYAGGFGTAGHVSGDVLFPIYLLYGISAIRQSGLEYSVLDAQAMKCNFTQVIDEVKKIAPNVIISWISLPSIYEDMKVLKEIKRASPETIIIGLGTVCNVMPDEVLINSNANAVVMGQYPHYNVVSNLMNVSYREIPDAFDNVPGAIYIKNNQIIHSPLKPCEEDLDQLSLDAYYELPMEKYLGGVSDINGSKVVCLPLVTGSGCPFSCMYCPYPVGYGKKVMQKSVDSIISEISFLKNNFGIKGFTFRDQLFTNNRERIFQLCNEIIKKDLDIKWNFEARADQVDKELILTMKKAGCFRIHYGVETGDPEMLENIGKPKLNVEMIKNAFKMTREAGIFAMAHIIIGLPGENLRTIEKSLELLQEIHANEVNVSLATPYPGTKLFKFADEKKWILTKDWSKYTGTDPVMRTDELNHIELNEARKRILFRFHLFNFFHDHNYRKTLSSRLCKTIWKKS